MPTPVESLCRPCAVRDLIAHSSLPLPPLTFPSTAASRATSSTAASFLALRRAERQPQALINASRIWQSFAHFLLCSFVVQTNERVAWRRGRSQSRERWV